MDDWEILEAEAGHLEEQLLNQVGVVQVGSPLGLWAHNRVLIRVKVTAVEPGPVARLGMGTEVRVAPRARPREAEAEKVKEEEAEEAEAEAEAEGGEGGGEGARPAIWLRVQVCVCHSVRVYVGGGLEVIEGLERE